MSGERKYERLGSLMKSLKSTYGNVWWKTRSLEERRSRNKRARYYKCGNLCGNKKEHPGDY